MAPHADTHPCQSVHPHCCPTITTVVRGVLSALHAQGSQLVQPWPAVRFAPVVGREADEYSFTFPALGLPWH